MLVRGGLKRVAITARARRRAASWQLYPDRRFGRLHSADDSMPLISCQTSCSMLRACGTPPAFCSVCSAITASHVDSAHTATPMWAPQMPPQMPQQMPQQMPPQMLPGAFGYCPTPQGCWPLQPQAQPMGRHPNIGEHAPTAEGHVRANRLAHYHRSIRLRAVSATETATPHKLGCLRNGDGHSTQTRLFPQWRWPLHSNSVVSTTETATLHTPARCLHTV